MASGTTIGGTNWMGTWFKCLVAEPDDIFDLSWANAVANNVTRLSRCYVYAGSHNITTGSRLVLDWTGTMLNRAIPFMKAYVYEDIGWTDKYFLGAPNSMNEDPNVYKAISIATLSTCSATLNLGTLRPLGATDTYSLKFYAWGQ